MWPAARPEERRAALDDRFLEERAALAVAQAAASEERSLADAQAAAAARSNSSKGCIQSSNFCHAPRRLDSTFSIATATTTESTSTLCRQGTPWFAMICVAICLSRNGHRWVCILPFIANCADFRLASFEIFFSVMYQTACDLLFEPRASLRQLANLLCVFRLRAHSWFSGLRPKSAVSRRSLSTASYLWGLYRFRGVFLYSWPVARQTLLCSNF